MALGVSRLLLSLSAMRRTAGTAAIPADLLLTQADEFIIAENGWIILANQSKSDTIKPDDIYHILTEDGELLQAQDNRFLGTQQEVIIINANDFILAENLDQITAENGWLILSQASSIPTVKPDDIYHILAENGDLLQSEDSRFLGTQQEVIVADADDFILAQNLDQITAQNGWLFLSNESDIPTIKPDLSSFFKTQDGLDILLTQQDDIFTTQQYIEGSADFEGDRDILTQDGEALYTQDGRSIQEDSPFIFNLLLTQNSDVLLTQDGVSLTLQQNEEVISAQAKLITQYGIELRTQDGSDLLTNQVLTTNAFDPPYELELLSLVTQEGNTLITENGDVLMLQDVYIAA